MGAGSEMDDAIDALQGGLPVGVGSELADRQFLRNAVPAFSASHSGDAGKLVLPQGRAQRATDETAGPGDEDAAGAGPYFRHTVRFT